MQYLITILSNYILSRILIILFYVIIHHIGIMYNATRPAALIVLASPLIRIDAHAFSTPKARYMNVITQTHNYVTHQVTPKRSCHARKVQRNRKSRAVCIYIARVHI